MNIIPEGDIRKGSIILTLVSILATILLIRGDKLSWFFAGASWILGMEFILTSLGDACNVK